MLKFQLEFPSASDYFYATKENFTEKYVTILEIIPKICSSGCVINQNKCLY